MFAERIDFSHEANLTIDELIKRAEVHLPETDLSLLRKCYEFSEKMHINQKRSSGELYIIHPLNVAATLIKLRMDLDSIMAGLLHDTVEDCDVSLVD
jgi:GTP pyrophosphokinase